MVRRHFDVSNWCWHLLGLRMERPGVPRESFKEKTIRLERRVEINFHLNLIFKIQSLQTIRTYFKICSLNFPRKSHGQCCSYRSAVIVVERSGCDHANRSLPIAQTLKSGTTMIPKGTKQPINVHVHWIDCHSIP